MHGRVSLRVVLAGMAVVCGCAAEPAFTARWSVEDAEDDESFPALTSAQQCSSLGIGSVSIETFGATKGGTRTLLDLRERPCFPPTFVDDDAAVAGPELTPGDYVVAVRGIRRDGASWTEILPADCDERQPLPVACASITVEDGETVTLDDFELSAPPQCEDGIDNDGDGLVDQRDPGCLGDQDQPRESDEVDFVQVRLQTSLLDHNCNATCSGLGLSRVVVDVAPDDEDADTVSFSCTRAIEGPQLFNRTLSTDETTPIEVYGVDAAGNRITTVQSFVMMPDQARVDLEVDFGDSDFLEAPQGRLRFLPQFFGAYGEDVSSCQGQGATRFSGCSADPSLGLGSLTLAQVAIRVLDAHGQPLSNSLVSTDGVLLDGTPSPCTGTEIVTEPVVWGGYLVEVEAMSADGEVCFSTSAPVPAAPGEGFVVQPERVVPPPPSCWDCQVDADCGDITSSGHRCVDHLCVP